MTFEFQKEDFIAMLEEKIEELLSLPKPWC
jgi:hypothetical protein